MSGTMPQQPPPQLPPQVMAMLMQQAMQRGQMPAGAGPPPPQMQGPMGMPNVPNPGQGGAPPMPPPGAAGMPPPGGMMPPGQMPQMAPRMPPPGMPPGQMPGPGPGQMQAPAPNAFSPPPAAALAQKGRFGDSVMAHMAPGEIAVPPEIQTPQLMAIIRQAFARAGVNPAMFTAGSQTASRNPQTGAPEFSLLSALLPVVGGVTGGVLGGPVGAAIGGGAGGAASGALSGMTPTQIAVMGLGGAAGGYLGAPSGAAPTAGVGDATAALGSQGANNFEAAQAARMAGGDTPAGMGLGQFAGSTGSAASGAGAAAGNQGLLGGLIPQSVSNLPWKAGLYAGGGAGLAGALTPGNPSSGVPSGFNNPLPALNPNFNALRGANTSSTPTFQGYNPYAAATGSPFTFYQPNT
jgi:hypothetical protein